MNRHHLVAAVAALASALPALAQTTPARTYTPGDFDRIEIAGAAQLQFTQGEPDRVVVEGDDAVQRSVLVELRDGLLSIRPSGGWKFWNNQRVQIAITARDLQRLTISGAADFSAPSPVAVQRLAIDVSGAGQARFDQLKAQSLRFTVSGSGDAHVAGAVDELSVGISGRSNFHGEDLMSQRSRVAISGLGDVKVWALQTLSIAVSGIGSVDYWGSPQVQRRSSGLSRVNDRGPKPAPATAP